MGEHEWAPTSVFNVKFCLMVCTSVRMYVRTLRPAQLITRIAHLHCHRVHLLSCSRSSKQSMPSSETTTWATPTDGERGKEGPKLRILLYNSFVWSSGNLLLDYPPPHWVVLMHMWTAQEFMMREREGVPIHITFLAPCKVQFRGFVLVSLSASP